FFFQAEGGIRAFHVTGVQTCALPILQVPKENVLPGVSSLRGPLSCLNSARYGISWGVIGAAIDCYEAALKYSLERKQFGKPIARSEERRVGKECRGRG